MKKSILKLLVILTFFLGFNLTAKAVDNYKLYFKYNNSETTDLSINITGSNYVNVPLYINVPSSVEVSGAVLPWTVGTGLNVEATNPSENAESGASIFYRIGTTYTKNIVLDNNSTLNYASNGTTRTVHLADLRITAPNVSNGSSAQIKFLTSNNGYQAVVATSTTSYNITGGATITVNKQAATSSCVSGDWTNDNRVTIVDVAECLDYALDPDKASAFNNFDSTKKACLDLDNNGRITILDVTNTLDLALS